MLRLAVTEKFTATNLRYSTNVERARFGLLCRTIQSDVAVCMYFLAEGKLQKEFVSGVFFMLYYIWLILLCCNKVHEACWMCLCIAVVSRVSDNGFPLPLNLGIGDTYRIAIEYEIRLPQALTLLMLGAMTLETCRIRT